MADYEEYTEYDRRNDALEREQYQQEQEQEQDQKAVVQSKCEWCGEYFDDGQYWLEIRKLCPCCEILPTLWRKYKTALKTARAAGSHRDSAHNLKLWQAADDAYTDWNDHREYAH